MFDSSKDILFLVIAVAVAITTIFTSWLLYYMIKILRRGYKSVELVTEKIEALAGLVDTLKDKIEHSATAVTLLSQAVTKLVGHWSKKRSAKKAKKSKSQEDVEDF
jgi:hypothetical protein